MKKKIEKPWKFCKIQWLQILVLNSCKPFYCTNSYADLQSNFKVDLMAPQRRKNTENHKELQKFL